MYTTYYLEQGLASPTIDTTSQIWHEGSPSGPLTTLQMGTGNSAVIEQSAPAPTTITVPGSVTLGSITLDANGPYELKFVAGTSPTISGGTIESQSDLVVDVPQNSTAEIDSSVSASSNSLTSEGQGSLVLGGTGSTVAVAALKDTGGTLTFNNSVEITNANGSGDGLEVADPAVLAGMGTITLDTFQTPLAYYSSATSTFAGTVTGNGDVEMDANSSGTTGTLTLTGSNTFTAGTFLSAGTLNINSAAALGDPALGNRLVTFDASATLQFAANTTFAGSGAASRFVIGPTSGDSAIVGSFDTASYTVTIPGIVSGYGILQNAYDPLPGMLVLGGRNTYSGGTDLAGDDLQLSGSQSTLGVTTGAGTGAVNMDANAFLDLNGVSPTIGSLYGYGKVMNTNSTLAQLTVDTNDPTTDTYAGQFGYSGGYKAISLVKKGTGTLLLTGTDFSTGATVIDAGTLQMGSADCLPSSPPYSLTASADLVVNTPGKLDLAGFNLAVGSLNSYDTGNNAIITNSVSGTTSIFYVVGDGNTSAFGGRILGNIQLDLYNGALTLTNTGNNFSAGTVLSDGHLFLGDGTTNGDGMVPGEIDSQDEDSVEFDVASGHTETFTGDIIRLFPYAGSGQDCYVTKSGGGTLDFDATTQADTYDSTTITGGDLVLESTLAIPAGSPVTIENAATLDVNQLSSLPAVGNVTLDSGSIIDGTLNVATGSVLTLLYGEIDASIVGDATMDKEQSSGPYTVVNTATGATIPANTVVFGVASKSILSDGTTIDYGTMQVYGSLASDVTVNGDSTLTTEEGSTVAGNVNYYSSASSDVVGAVTRSGNELYVDGAGAVTLGQPTANGSSGANSIGTTVVSSGTLIVETSDGLATGSTLIVGDPSYFSGVTPGDAMGGGGGRLAASGGHSSGGSDDASGPFPPAGSLMGQVDATGGATGGVVSDVLDPNYTRTASDMFNAATLMVQVAAADVSMNGGTRTLDTAVVNEAITQVLTTDYNMTVATASGTPNYVQTEAAVAIANTSGYGNQAYAMVSYNLAILEYFTAYDVTPD